MYGKQEAAIFAPERYSIVEASTKAGKTVGCIVWLTERAMRGEPGQNFWWVAPVTHQAKIAYRRLKRGLPRELYRENRTELTLTLPNECTIWFKGADKPDTLYGEDVYGAVIDEATRVKQEAWYAIRSTLTATEAPVRIIGNVKGRKNWAYRLARKAEQGAANMAYAKLTAYDAIQAGVLSEDEVADAQATLPEAVFRELYLAEPSDDEGNPFGIKAIRACVVEELSPLPPVCWGWDLAKHVDWTVGIGLDREGAVCRLERFQRTWDHTLHAIVAATEGVRARVDATGVGDPIMEQLQRAGSNYEPYKFTQTSKQQLMEGLALGIQQNSIRFPEGVIVQELESFEYEVTRTGVRYTAPSGMHDDCVTALGLAWSAFQTGRVPLVEWGSMENVSYWHRDD